MNRMFDDPLTGSASTPQARIAELADQCVMCGLCLPHCPTYALDATEAESPRGRIRLARALTDGSLTGDLNPVREYLDHCLSCGQCERACPSQVRYGELLVQTRAIIGPAPQRPTRLLDIVSHPRLATPLIRLARVLRAPQWMPALLERVHSGTATSMRAALRMLGSSPSRGAAARSDTRPAPTPERPRVGLFPGCMASEQEAAALKAVERLLDAAGFAVQHLPVRCCGAMDRHDGLPARATRAARATEKDWRHADSPETVLTITSGCLDTLRHDLPATRVEDALDFLARHADRLRFRPLALRAALHVPCTRGSESTGEDAALRLLRRVPELDVQVLPTAPGCCGAAGSHALTFPARAERLRAIKLEQIDDLAVDRLLSSNIGCRLHLAAGNPALPTEHPLTLLERQLESA
ncbi:(Fe-S)-binding protein [Oleiagrimonas citrea]|nr:(Fe-S)-binding protein [Oleiagrimonas citrea]